MPNNQHFQPQRQVLSVNQNHTIVQHSNGVRINETLLGRIMGARNNGMVFDYEWELRYTRTEKTIERPMDFGNDIVGWFNYIRAEAKAVMNKIHAEEQEEKEYQKTLLKEKEQKFLEDKRKFYRDNGMLPAINN